MVSYKERTDLSVHNFLRFGRSGFGICASRLAEIGKLPDFLDEPELGMCTNKLTGSELPDSLNKPRLEMYVITRLFRQT
ncbi:hypothetical protein RclHR1_22680002 [Rhizophagus clarus]|uniref:Uncharacterized protein n=1 Tax=Rhizophagus clarus TaxID=94130 RepID=A0A2Z6R867_9GLOM|nr:hypothetical protein RclHR1_22680002 [Rhizophagus clarus]